MTPPEKLADVLGRTVAETQRSNAISEADLNHAIESCRRALVLLDEGRCHMAMQAAGIAAGMANQAARRIEVAAAMRSVAGKVAEAKR
jgi:hypothetical protein